METKKIEFTPQQFHQLMKLIYLGRWMANSHKDEPDVSLEDLEQYIFSFATKFGYTDLLEYDESYEKYFPSLEWEDEMDSLIQDYDDYTFWDELAWRMAERDFMNKFDHSEIMCMTSEEIFREKNAFADKYFEEFITNGIDKLSLDK